MSVLRISFAVLIALKLDQTLTCSWWLVFFPVWIYIGTLVIPHVRPLVFYVMFLCGTKQMKCLSSLHL
jgi:hypothetical protein